MRPARRPLPRAETCSALPDKLSAAATRLATGALVQSKPDGTPSRRQPICAASSPVCGLAAQASGHSQQKPSPTPSRKGATSRPRQPAACRLPDDCRMAPGGSGTTSVSCISQPPHGKTKIFPVFAHNASHRNRRRCRRSDNHSHSSTRNLSHTFKV